MVDSCSQDGTVVRASSDYKSGQFDVKCLFYLFGFNQVDIVTLVAQYRVVEL